VSRRRRLGLPVAVAVLALVLLLGLRPLSTPRALGIWLILIAALVLLTLARDVRSQDASHGARRFEAELRRRPAAPSLPVEFLRMERELELGIANADQARRRLLPLLRTAAAARLATSHGVELGRSPEAARALLGDEIWEWLRPDRPLAADRHARGIPRPVLEATIARLESL